MKNNYSILVLFVLIFIAGFFIGKSFSTEWNKNTVNNLSLPLYSFTDMKTSVSAKGSFISKTEPDFLPTVTDITCFHQDNFCILNGVTTNFSSLNTSSYLIPITTWTDNFVIADTGKIGCIEETYTLDRKMNTVTYNRKTLKTDEYCKDIIREPMTATLEGGAKRLELISK